MKKLILSTLLLCFSLWSYADYIKSYQKASDNTTEIVISVMDLKDAERALTQFVTKHALQAQRFSVSKTEIQLALRVDKSLKEELDSVLASLGYTVEHKSSVLHHQDVRLRLERNIELKSREKLRYERLVADMDSTKGDKYFLYWEKIISLESSIEEDKIDLDMLNRKQQVTLHNIKVMEELRTEHNYGSNWVNMPGIEYSMMWTENPVNGQSPEQMQGFGLKYMFNRGKSYGLLSLYKSLDATQATEIDQTYMFAYGQDFYSRKLGRGERKFFNLYTSINLGVYNSSSKYISVTSWFVNPFLGLELYKNKHILIDTKVGYFLPYKNNRMQRALMYNASFNFVF